MNELALRHKPQLLAGALGLGLAAANVLRVHSALALVVAVPLAVAATLAVGPRRVVVTAAALALVGWWWGSARLDSLDRSPLLSLIDTAGRVRVTITGPARRGTYDVRAPGSSRGLRGGDCASRSS
jgi:hypothetical protein